ncbi:MAG: DUF4152 family protein [Candidatus Bathyarchaeota archaeon]|nr:DUF4152 family protein [Candidatus Bathyarchaeota archaeon]
MRIVSADSAAAILDEEFEPQLMVACGAVLVEEPYNRARVELVEPLFLEADDSREVIVREAEMCLRLLDCVDADVVHLDMTFGGLSVEELSPVELFNQKPSLRARQNLLKILPKLRKVAAEIHRKHDIETLAIGKESIPVRIAELTTAAIVETLLTVTSMIVKPFHVHKLLFRNKLKTTNLKGTYIKCFET